MFEKSKNLLNNNVFYDNLSINVPANLDESILQSLTKMPSINNPADSVLPSNFTSINSSQLESALSPKLLNQKLDSNIANLDSLISDKALGAFKDLVPAPLTRLNELPSAMASLEASLQKVQDKFSTDSANQMLSIFSNNKNIESLGAINQAYSSAIEKATALSPKGLRDLQQPGAVTAQAQQAASKALESAKAEIKNQITSQTQNQAFNNNGQSNLQQMSSPSFSGDNKNGFDLFVRLTVYWAYGSGTDKDSAAKRSSTGRQLAQGISAAVDPSVIPYLSRIEIPGLGTRFATDTGGAVKARTASSGRLPIIDIFYEKKEDALAAANSMKKEVAVKVYPPNSKYKYAKNSPPTYGVA